MGEIRLEDDEIALVSIGVDGQELLLGIEGKSFDLADWLEPVILLTQSLQICVMGSRLILWPKKMKAVVGVRHEQLEFTRPRLVSRDRNVIRNH